MIDSKEQNQEFYIIPLVLSIALLATGYSLPFSGISGLALGGLIYLYQHGHLQDIWLRIRDFVLSLWPAETTVTLNQYDVPIGRQQHNARLLIGNLRQMKSIAIWAINGGGKTSFLHMFIHSLVSMHSPDEIRLLISDMKEGLDFSIYQRLPHLALPIAETVGQSHELLNWLQDEKTRRSKYFKAIPASKIHNSLDRYHALIDANGYTLPKLPRIVAVFDECQTLTQDKESTKILIDIAKTGRAYGIHLVLSTQRASVDAIPGDLRSELNTRIVGMLGSPREYYLIAEVPKEIYDGVSLKPGQFFISMGGGQWHTINARWIPENQLEKTAAKLSTDTKPTWPKKQQNAREEMPVKIQWTGNTEHEKISIVRQIATELGRKPTDTEFCDRVEASLRTAQTWIPKAMEDYEI